MAMNEPHGVRVLRQCLDDFNSHDLQRASRLYRDDVTHSIPALQVAWHGREVRQQALGRIFLASSDIHMRLTSALCEGDRVVGEWIMTGTSERPFGDLPATGRRFQVRGATCATLSGGRVHHQADYWDLPTVLRQLGLLLPRSSR